ncbi:methyltransferase domain-containing protein [Agrobacterium vitis]|uniref:class I SAM-dependent DNA methyltransferase n=1 Tax=Rhizobium/Agrobacterium group TaxID=227290 RepID=UPI0012E769C0|nr:MULTISPECIES: class I SAM-dependent methyltransferase [Rhizobium/Agrobacterium group]MCF1496235.1 class I SAM-dependent methyltransferase [Allorhizobium ampelinum]MVA48942.1 methyltransferase domain-containing protein [Agrobacterium vitis]
MSQEDGNYDNWAWLYNRTLGPDYLMYKRGFLKRTLVDRSPAGGRILDLCCGTGQMIAPLMQLGFEVTGLDYSADMLKYACENAPSAKLVHGDARNFSFDETFDGVLSMSASLNHMASLDDLGRVFGCVHRALREGGVFVFDVNHPAQLSAYWRGQPAEGEIEADHAWLITPRYDANQHTGAFTVDIWRRPSDAASTPIKDLTGRVLSLRRLNRLRLARLARFGSFRPDWEHRSTDYPIRGHDLAEVEALLRKTGFEVSIETINGDRTIDNRRAAHFVCQKLSVAAHPQQEQLNTNARSVS